MAAVLDLESGGGAGGNDSDTSSVCFSDAEEGSCCSQFYSTAGDGSHDGDDEVEEEEAVEITESRRASSVADSDCSVAVGSYQNKSCVIKVERDCRICHLSLEYSGPESGVAIELGCSCKNDLAASHKHCAEEWFRIKGNRVCEICNSIAQNVVVVYDIGPVHHISNDTSSEDDTNPAREPMQRARRACPDGRFLNFVLALMVFAFVLSWLFHFNVHS